MTAVPQNNHQLNQEFLSLLHHKQITTHFQAIVSLSDGEVLGYEALSRGPEKSWFYRPDRLFDHARRLNRVWELDLLCRSCAIQNARETIGKHKLFINVDPDSILDPKFRKGFTREQLKSVELDAATIIIELTEKTAVTDYRHFNRLLRNYLDQGYRIAIDDAGSGYSGLRLIAETRPDYLKIDMDLVRNVDKDMVKRELLRSVQRFAQLTGIKTIAEGIETWDEARALMDMGVHYGQGYWIQKPAPVMGFPAPEKVEAMKAHGKLLTQLKGKSEGLTAREIMRQDATLQLTDRCRAAGDLFSENDNLQGIALLQQNRPLGLVMRSKYYYQMEKSGDAHRFQELPLGDVADLQPLMAGSDTPLLDLCRMAMSRREHQLYDYLVIHEDQQYCGVIPVALLLDTLARRQEENQFSAT
ncbi:EAL domain-containing protein [Anoxynatronum buryatiense]|uniref:EAL domain, c-di-GMP-specific phosphodiesterase class I (Or its enzymatically inactive variant) n=1 Tax=Anoxynatronum buryatiense TaxID=489973 RepID=A0AA45WYZ2_9CLOT|nr:EAL domain-containing protein [Anoxynatronum buryatiense]SMP70430.1 EAL domain, c-di-GMP-specific phosphodiesterase class I (or its enzymatically inactive variant) [Anoxynatronum buryatiense]